MCNHKYKIKLYDQGETCYLEEVIRDNYKKFGTKDMPHDSEGLCLFHSEDSAFKTANKYEIHLRTLISVFLNIDDYDSVDLRGLYHSEDALQFELNRVSTDKEIHLSGAYIAGEMRINNGHFRGAFFMDACVVVGRCKMEKTYFYTTFTATDETIWHSTLTMREVIFHDLCEFTDARFFGQLDIKGVIFEGYCRWDNIVVKSDTNAFTYMQFRINGNLDCRDASFHNTVQMEDCEFFGDTKFINTQFYKGVFFTKPTIAAKLLFSGDSETDRMFRDELEMTINDTNFEGVGQIIFRNCNLSYLDKITKSQLEDLISKRLFVLEEGTIAYRFSFEEKFLYSEATEVFIQDLLSTIRQYFAHRIRRHFQISINRKDEILIVSFHTDDYKSEESFVADRDQVISELISSSQQTISDGIEHYLATKFKGQLDTILKKQLAGLDKTIVAKILSLENVKLYLACNNVDMITTTTLQIQDSHIGKMYVDRLDKMENEPIFNLNDTQFTALKNELGKLNKDEDWKEMNKLLQDIKDKVSLEEDLKTFLINKGVSIGDKITSSLLFIFISYLFLK